MSGFDVEALRARFPALAQTVNGKPLVYFDSAATALKPDIVIDTVRDVYGHDCANIHRAVHTLSQRATARYEATREKVIALIGARSTKEIVYTRGTTEGINLVAQTWGRANLRPGDEILLTGLEHHSNIVPWQLVREQTGAEIVVVPVTPEGDVRIEDVEARLTDRTKLVAMAHVSNALGTVLPIAEIIRRAHARGAKVLIDGAQAAPHLRVDVEALDCDFYAFSGHKVYGPTGIGILYGKEALLEAMPPYQGGGDMIDRVTFEKTTWNELPYKFEAGTPDIAGVIGLGAAIDFLLGLDRDAVEEHERDVLAYATAGLAEVPGLRIVGTAKEKVAVASFVMEGLHPSDIGTLLDTEGVAVRTGHHCTQPLMDALGLPATARASFGIYNTRQDVDALVRALHKVHAILG
jgi:cysteine desulfurase/selenocysteine lyase